MVVGLFISLIKARTQLDWSHSLAGTEQCISRLPPLDQAILMAGGCLHILIFLGVISWRSLLMVFMQGCTNIFFVFIFLCQGSAVFSGKSLLLWINFLVVLLLLSFLFKSSRVSYFIVLIVHLFLHSIT